MFRRKKKDKKEQNDKAEEINKIEGSNAEETAEATRSSTEEMTHQNDDNPAPQESNEVQDVPQIRVSVAARRETYFELPEDFDLDNNQTVNSQESPDKEESGQQELDFKAREEAAALIIQKHARGQAARQKVQTVRKPPVPEVTSKNPVVAKIKKGLNVTRAVKKKSAEERAIIRARKIFMHFLFERRGSTFRAWRMDIDRRNTNRVAYTDLMEACRHMGLKLQHSRLIWQAWRPENKGCPATPIEFHEFDPAEWKNLNHFLEILWEAFNFDLDEAWEKIDADGAGFVTSEQWQKAVQSLGFDGDAEQVFLGLDTCGQGRVWKHELQYLKLLPPESHGQPEDSPLVQELRAWCLKVWETPRNLLSKMGLRHGGSSMSTTSLAHQLARLGFPGDPLHTAMALSRCNHHICMEEIMELLSPHSKGHEHSSVSYAGALINSSKARRKLAADAITDKPPWNDTIWTPVDLNEALSYRERHYFSSTQVRPVKDQIHRRLKENKKLLQQEFI